MRRIIVALLAASAVGLAACGDDEDGGGEALSTDEYRAEVTKICTEGNKAEDDLGEPASAKPDDLVAFFEKGLDTQKTFDERFAALEPPDEFADAHAEVEKLDSEAQTIIQGVIDDIEKGESPQSVIEGLEADAERISKRGNELADQVGVPACKET